MKLMANFPENLDTEMLLECKLIPCVVKVAKEFKIEFGGPLVNIVGKVSDWKVSELNARSPASGGGKFLHYRPAQITLVKKSEGEFEIVDLRFFVKGMGWLTIIEDSVLAEKGRWI